MRHVFEQKNSLNDRSKK